MKSTSPCINAGITDTTGLSLPSVDLDGNARIYGGRIDLGAYEYGSSPTGIKPAVAGQNAAVVFPNPSLDGIFYIIANANKIEWTVYDLNGKQLLTGNQPLVDLSAFGKGIYILKTGNRTAKLIRL